MVMSLKKFTNLNNVPTIVPKRVKPIERTLWRILNSIGVISMLLLNMMNPDDLTKSFENETGPRLRRVAILQQQIKDLKKHVNKVNTTLSCKKELLDTKKWFAKSGTDRFRHNTTRLKFCIGFENFDTLKAALDYLNPKANSPAYWGSNSN